MKEIPEMSVKQLKQELTQRGLLTDGLKPVLVERLTEAMAWKNSNVAFHSCSKQVQETAVGLASAEEDVAALEDQLTQIQAELDAARQRLPILKREQTEAQRKLDNLEPRLFFAPKLPACVLLSIMGQLGKRVGGRAACVKREWQGSVETAKALGMYKGKPLLSVAAGASMTAVCSAEGQLFTFGAGVYGMLGHGGEDFEYEPRLVEALTEKKMVGVSAGTYHTAAWTDDGELFTFGHGVYGKLGHGWEDHEPVPKLVQALAGKKVVGATSGECHTAAWTDEGELFTIGAGSHGNLGHGGTQNELVPKLVEALAGKKVVGASARGYHTAVWTKEGELFTFGLGDYGKLGHGAEDHELVPRLVEALAGKKVIGAAAGANHTAVWTDEGELFTFGTGRHGRLGHGGTQNELVPRQVESLAGKKVIGATSGMIHTAAWTEEGELLTFGDGDGGRLGHGGTQNKLVPRLVEALVGKRVIGASAGIIHTAAWTEEGELFTFGYGSNWMLGHGGEQNELVPRLVEALLKE